MKDKYYYIDKKTRIKFSVPNNYYLQTRKHFFSAWEQQAYIIASPHDTFDDVKKALFSWVEKKVNSLPVWETKI